MVKMGFCHGIVYLHVFCIFKKKYFQFFQSFLITTSFLPIFTHGGSMENAPELIQV